jgi:hypothetical protein
MTGQAGRRREPQLQPEQQALVGVGQAEAEQLLGPRQPVPAGVGVHVQPAVFYHAVHSRLGPERTAVNVGEAVADAEQEERALEVEPA